MLLTLILSINSIILTGCNEGRDNYNKGLDALEEKDYETAADEFEQAISLSPDRGEYYIIYGNTLLMSNNNDEAINVFNQVITDKDSQEAKENNKEAYYGKGIAYYNKGEYDKSIEQFDLSLDIGELEDKNVDILLYKGDSQIASGLFKEAIKTLTSAIELNSSDASIYLKRADTYTKIDDYVKAEEDLDAAIALEPDNYDYYFKKFEFLKEQDKDEEATRLLDEIIQIKIKDEEDRFNNAKANYYLENYDLAKGEFQKTVDEGIVEGNYYLGRLQEQEEDYEGAIAYYEKIINVPQDESKVSDYYLAAANNQMGYCYLQAENFEQALDNFNQGLELGVKSLEGPLLRNKVVALESLSDYQEAYEVLEDYVAQYPTDEEALRELEFVKTRLPEASTTRTN